MNGIPLTPAVLRAAYEYLSATPPFRSWNLPAADDVAFRVVRDPHVFGHYKSRSGRHEIALSRRSIGRTLGIMETMAHEMVHLHQELTGMATHNVVHNAAFKKLAAQVCRHHGFDPFAF